MDPRHIKQIIKYIKSNELPEEVIEMLNVIFLINFNCPHHEIYIINKEYCIAVNQKNPLFIDVFKIDPGFFDLITYRYTISLGILFQSNNESLPIIYDDVEKIRRTHLSNRANDFNMYTVRRIKSLNEFIKKKSFDIETYGYDVEKMIEIIKRYHTFTMGFIREENLPPEILNLIYEEFIYNMIISS